jgi:hypothetical protein
MARKLEHKAYFNNKVCVETEKKNQKGETMKKPEIIQDNKKFM